MTILNLQLHENKSVVKVALTNTDQVTDEDRNRGPARGPRAGPPAVPRWRTTQSAATAPPGARRVLGSGFFLFFSSFFWAVGKSGGGKAYVFLRQGVLSFAR